MFGWEVDSKFWILACFGLFSPKYGFNYDSIFDNILSYTRLKKPAIDIRI